MLRLLILLFVPAFAFADTPAEALKKLGAEVKLAGADVVEVRVNVAAFTEAEYKLLAQCTKVKTLTFSGGKTLTDATLPLLAPLTELETFSVDHSQLTDDGYKHFAPFVNLKKLALWHPSWASKEFTGSGIAHLKALPKLERLTFAGSTAGDDFLEGLAQVTQLKEFSTWHTAQTQAGNAHFLKLTNLVHLKIGQRLPKYGTASPPSFDGSTIPTLAKIATLESLELVEARLNAKDLEPLKGLPKLKKLVIHGTDISEEDVAKVKAMLPNATVTFTPLTEMERENLTKKLKL
jgi:hypothetical protein